MNNCKISRRTRVATVALLASAALALSACSTDGAEGSSSGAGASVGPTSDAFMAELAKGYETPVPTTGPSAAKGKKVWWISCGESVPDCSVPAAAGKEAAGMLGIDFNIADGKLNAGGGNAAAVRTALAASPDALIVHGFSCAQAQQALQEANDAHVLVMGLEGMDCNEAGGTGPALFNVKMKYSATAETAVDYFQSWGTLAAKYAIGATGGHAKIVNNAGVEPLMTTIDQAFNAGLKACSGCAIAHSVHFGSPDYGPQGPWIQQFRSALAKNPTANAAYIPVDAGLSFSGGPQAVMQSGTKMITFGGTGGSAGMDLVRTGEMAAVTGAHDVKWMGYAAIDNINRALMGEDTVPQGVGSVVVDKNHSLPTKAGEGYSSSIDWKAAYMKLWGIN